ncbi:MAG: carbohydrate kinase [Actinobacteria bacterium]|nr:carbohydrate kinase [Actinomycetota bacterium]
MSHVLAVDLGSSGLKVAVVDRGGRVVGAAGAPLATRFLAGGGAEQDAHGWWHALGECSRQALAGAGVPGSAVEAVSVTAQYMSIVAVDRRGLPLAPVVMWMDRRGAPHRRGLRDPHAAAVLLERHGLPPMPTDDQAHIAFLRAEHPAVHEAAAAFVEPADHLTARLTGRITATQTTAFPLMTVDNRTRGATAHDPDLVALAGVDPAKLPPLVPDDEIVGCVTPEAAEHLGISTSAIVVPGTIDSITSAVGAGVLDPSACAVIVGTTTVIVTHVDAKAADLDHGLISVPSPLPGRYFVMAENGVGGKALDVFLRQVVYADDALALGPFPGDAFERAEAAAATVAPGSDGVLFLPWFVGSMAPGGDRAVRAGFVNLGLSTTRAAMTRAVYEGVALNAAWLLPHVAAFADATWTSVRFGGGGARSDLWAQTLADATGVDVDQLADPGSTNARGAALLALVRLGHLALDDIPALVPVRRRWGPDPERNTLYRRALERFVDFHERSRPFYAALNGRTSHA